MIRRNVLIFHQAALGDFIVTWPIAMALSRILPQSRIVYVTHSQKGALAERVLRVESADAEAGWHGLLIPPPEQPRLPDRAASLLDAAHTVISFTASDDDALARGVARAAPHARLVSLNTRRSDDPADANLHVTQSLARQLTDWPALASAVEQMLRGIASRGAGFSRSTQSGRIVIHPGAGKESHRWPTDRFLELTRRLRDSGKQPVVLLGEAEIERWPAQLIRQFESDAAVHRPPTLLALLDELASAEVFVGNDSGPGHLAGIIGVPTVSLFGAGSSSRWRPLGPAVHVIHASSIEQIEVQTVLQEIQLAPERC